MMRSSLFEIVSTIGHTSYVAKKKEQKRIVALVYV